MRELTPNLGLQWVSVYLQDNFFAREGRDCPLTEVTLSEYAQQWLESLSGENEPGLGYELSLRLTDDAEIHQFNARYRDRDKPTDVLAFAEIDVDFPDLAELGAAEPLYLGDIVISIETAQRQAEQQQHSLRVELLWLFAHGLLHLLGWDHPTEERLQEMLTQQQLFLQKIGVFL